MGTGSTCGTRRPRSWGLSLFLSDEGGYTTVAFAVAMLVSLTLVFSAATAEWATTREADVQSVADACALAAAPRFPAALVPPVSHAPAQSQAAAAAVTLGFAVSAPLGSGILPFSGGLPPMTQGLNASIYGVSPDSSRPSVSSSGFDMSSLERAL